VPVRESTMDDKKTQLTDIVGETAVIDNPRLEEALSLDHNRSRFLKSHLMVQPGNVDEVQKIVLWANQTLTPLVPLSSGPPHFRGDSIPTAPEAVMVDLSRMKRIPKINRRNRLVLIEPGVTFDQLLPALHKEGLRIAMPLLPRANKSVLASLLEREPVMSPKYQWNLLEPLRSLEIVWGNGDKFYSGSGVLRGEKDEDWEQGLVPVWGPGPAQLDFYKFVSAAQGSMGIVTWASVKCEVFPELRKLFFVPAEKLEDLVAFTYQLLKFRFGDELFVANNACLAYMLAGTADEVQSLRETLPSWAVIVGIGGGHILAEERVRAREADIRDIARQSGLKMVADIPGCRGDAMLELLLKPSGEPYWKLRYKGEAQELFFLTTLDRAPSFVATIGDTAGMQQYPAEDIGVYLQPVHQGVGCHCEFVLPFSRSNQAEVKRIQELFRDASYRLFRQGAYFSRPYGMWADMVFNADGGTMNAIRKIKAIFDPHNVMNPGKLCF
jgi:FAD/FMN-containing dehydrogenase